jgi:hypothetical protein
MCKALGDTQIFKFTHLPFSNICTDMTILILRWKYRKREERTPYEYNRKIYVIHDRRFNRIYRAVMVTTNTHKYSKLSVTQQCIPTYSGQPRGHLQVYRLQRLVILKVK